MNLDLDDDPLGDLLSDGSNDSLFGIEPPKKVATTSTTKVEKKDVKEPTKKMEQLFGIREEKLEQIMPKMENPSSSPIKNVPKALPRSAPPPKSPTRSNNDSLTSDLGFDPKQPKKKSSVLDELLGITASESTAAKLPQKSTSKAPISRQTTSETTMSEQHAAIDNPMTTARKSNRRQSAVAFSDPLGLLGEQQSIKKTQKLTGRKSIAGTEWLFNDPPPLTKLKSSPLIQVTSNVNEQKPLEDEPGSSNVTSIESKGKVPPPPIMESLAADTQNTLNNLKQQEFQLMVAAQMKTQENVLVEMKNKQQELLKQQEHQFNELLKKQIVRQSELEEIIKNQQERINSHIQALMTSSQTHIDIPYIKPMESTASMAAGVASPNEKIELESDVKRLEMEKLRLEDLLSNIQDNHEKEIIMMESSYKKRIQLMEENLESMEQRYKNEIMTLEKFYGDKIKSINDERETVIGNFEVKIKLMEESHQNFIDKLKTNYEQDLVMLKSHYEEMMQNIRKSKFMEFAIREESLTYADMMKRASSNLESASGDIHSLHEVLQEKLNVVERDREILLNAREKRLEEQQKLLERAREASEAERQKLLELVHSLEFKLNTIEQKSEEEQWSLKEKLMAFEVERKSFEKEKEFLRNQIASEQQKVQEQKQSQLNEHAKLLKEIEEERLKLHEERARCEIAKTLQSKNADDTGRSRAEIDAAVKYAEDAAQQLEKERERLIELQRQFEAKRREMMDRENALRVKQSELENSIIKVKQRETQAENALRQTKKTELVLMSKYQSLQKYTMDLSERETKIAKERLDLNAEKLEMQTQRKKLYETRCSLCKIGEKANELKGIMQLSKQSKDANVDDDFDDINGANNERVNVESFNFDTRDMNLMANIAEDLENVPNLVDMNDDMLDSDLLMLKFDVLNSISK